MKHLVFVSALALAVFVSLLAAVPALTAPPPAPPPGPQLLARVEGAAPGLPAAARLRDAAGREYTLVVAGASALQAAGAPFRALDVLTPGATYVLARERTPGARDKAGALVTVLNDDGRTLLARATPAQAEALTDLGLEIAWLDTQPRAQQDAPPLLAPGVPDPWVQEMVDAVQDTTVYTYDGGLSGEWPVIVGGSPYVIATRSTRSGTPIQKATQYVYEHLQTLGLNPSYYNWSGCSLSNRNVIGVITGTVSPSEIVLVTAHLDSTSPSYMTLAPGADDNGSGSTGVLIAADIMKNYRFERTVRFVFFTGEEQGLCGSTAYAAYVRGLNENIVAVYNMDMIGYNTISTPPTLRIHTRTSGSGYQADLAIANVFTNVVNTYGLSGNLTPILDPDGIAQSDHYPFWQQGYAGILAIEDDLNDFSPYYHTVNDRLSSLDLNYFTAYVKASVGTAATLAHPLGTVGTATPTVTGTPPTSTPTRTSTPTPTATACVPGDTGYGITTSTGATLVPGSTDVGNHCDDCTTVVTLPFPVLLYGTVCTTITVGSNGTLACTINANNFNSVCLPDTFSSNAIFGYWDDLRTDIGSGCAGYPSGQCGIYSSVSGSPPNRTFHLEWRAATYAVGATTNFEIRLHEAMPDFEIVYGTVADAGNAATVGVQKDTGSKFTQFSCGAGGLSQGLQLSFALIQCGSPTATATGGPASATPTVTGTGPASATPTGTATATALPPTATATATPTAQPPTETATSMPAHQFYIGPMLYNTN
jgi:hypothetical protein